MFGAFIYDAIADGKNRFIFKNFKESEFLISGLNFMGGSQFEIKKIGGKIRKKKAKKNKRQNKRETRQDKDTKQNKTRNEEHASLQLQRGERALTVENEAEKRKKTNQRKERD